MRIQKKVASYEKMCKWKTGLIGQANGSKLVYLLADPNAAPFKGRFPPKFLEARKLLSDPSYFVIVGFTNTKLFAVMTIFYQHIFNFVFLKNTSKRNKSTAVLMLLFFSFNFRTQFFF